MVPISWNFFGVNLRILFLTTPFYHKKNSGSSKCLIKGSKCNERCFTIHYSGANLIKLYCCKFTHPFVSLAILWFQTFFLFVLLKDLGSKSTPKRYVLFAYHFNSIKLFCSKVTHVFCHVGDIFIACYSLSIVWKTI